MTDPQRVAKLFKFDYTLEMYKPARTRVWGRFASPILHGDRLIGKLDARSDRDSGQFIVHRIHEDEPFTAAMRDEVNNEIESFAWWLRLEVSWP